MSEIDLLGKLNDEQKEAVMHTEGPLMIVAGAGTGKTTVVTHRIAWLIDQGHVKPEGILALTFTDKAAGEMEERVDCLLPYGYVDLQISTFHAFCERLLREFGVEIGLSRDFRLANELDAWLLTRQSFDTFDLKHYRPLGNPTKFLRSLLTHYSRAKDSALEPDKYLEFVNSKYSEIDLSKASEEEVSEHDRLHELAKSYQTYQDVLLANDSLDFGDLLLYSLKLLKERPGVLETLRARYPFVLVDEFQDTNDAQYQLVKLIAGPKNNLTVVGDDDQSIYKFRGASLANILRFDEDYSSARKIVLTKNYRSVQKILDHAHAFIQHNNPNRLEASSEGALSKKLEAHHEGEGVIEHIHAPRIEDEVAKVVEKISDLKVEGVDWKDFAILVRSNNAGTDFAQALERHKIPFQFLALSGLYTKSVILDLLAWIRIVDDSYDSPSMYRILTQEMHSFSERLVMDLNHLARKEGRSLFQACETATTSSDFDPEDSEKLRTLIDQIEGYQKEARTRRVGELFIVIAKETGYLEWMNTLDERLKQDSFGYLQQFYERLKGFERRHEAPMLHNFLSEFKHERDAGEEGSLSVDMEDGPDTVRIMTVHAAKGLEFKYVFVVNLVNQRFPTRKKSEAIPLPEGLVAVDDTGEHVEEERRLFYVAMTRAKEGLFFTSAKDYGGARKRKISRFLNELGYEDLSSDQSVVIDLTKEGQEVVQVDELHKYPIPKQFSFTQLAAFNTCPLQYKFAHILKVPVFGKWTFSFGKSMHNTLQRFFTVWLERVVANDTDENVLPVTLEEMMEMYALNWLDDWYVNDRQREEYRAKGRESLKAFYRQTENEGATPFSIEMGFTLKLGDIVVKGRIDRIDTFEDGVEIIDYKTGTPKTAKKLSKGDKEQLLLYHLAARDVLGLAPKRLTFHYLEDNSKVHFVAKDKELIELQEKIVDRVQNIRSSSFNATPGFHCKFCDFADICSFRAK